MVIQYECEATIVFGYYSSRLSTDKNKPQWTKPFYKAWLNVACWIINCSVRSLFKELLKRRGQLSLWTQHPLSNTLRQKGWQTKDWALALLCIWTENICSRVLFNNEVVKRAPQQYSLRVRWLLVDCYSLQWTDILSKNILRIRQTWKSSYTGLCYRHFGTR